MARLKLMFSHLSLQLLLVFSLFAWAVIIIGEDWYLLWLAPVGLLAQMLNEYSIHRYLFHWPAPKSQFWFDVLYRVHYGHHDFPDNRELLFVPVWFAIPMAIVNLALFWGALTLIGFAQPFAGALSITFIGGVTTFIFYEWFHMTAHTNVKKFAIERHVTRLHGAHHFRDFTKSYHVNPGGIVIDKLMGTAIDQAKLKQKGRIQFLTTLGLKPNDARLLSARSRFASYYGISEQEVVRAART